MHSLPQTGLYHNGAVYRDVLRPCFQDTKDERAHLDGSRIDADDPLTRGHTMVLNKIVGYHVGARIQLSVCQCPLGVKAFADSCGVWVRGGN